MEYRKVKAGDLHDGMMAIESGIGPDDWVIVKGLLRARPGIDSDAAVSDEKGSVEPGRGTVWAACGKNSRQPQDEIGGLARPMFSRFFIDRPILASVPSILITLLGLGGGLYAAGGAVSRDHAADGSSDVQLSRRHAQVLADTVAAPIEQQVNGVEDMLYMSSQCSNDGSYSLMVTFKVGTNLDMAQVLVQNRVALAQPILPDVVKQIGVSVKKRSPDLMFIVNLYSPNGRYDQLYMSNYALIQVRDAIWRVGGRRRRVHLRPARLQHEGLAESVSADFAAI